MDKLITWRDLTKEQAIAFENWLEKRFTDNDEFDRADRIVWDMVVDGTSLNDILNLEIREAISKVKSENSRINIDNVEFFMPREFDELIETLRFRYEYNEALKEAIKNEGEDY